MGHVRKLTGKRGTSHQACWRDATGRQRTATFATAALARAYLRQVDSDLHTGAYVDPHGPRTLLREWVDVWLPTQHGRSPATRRKVTSQLEAHVLPQWGDVQLGQIRGVAVKAWVAQLAGDYSASYVRDLHGLLSQILAEAVRERLIPANPAVLTRGDLPRVAGRSERYLTAQEIAAVAEALDGRYRALVTVTGWTGLRWGEVTALRWSDVTLSAAGGQLSVTRAASNVAGRIVYGPPKTEHSRRDVVLDPDTAGVLRGHQRRYGGHELVFTGTRGGPLHRSHFASHHWQAAVKQAGLEHCGFHALRHSHAALMIAAGMNILTLSRRLGHASAAMTLDRYGHLQRDHVDATLSAIHQARRGRDGQEPPAAAAG